MGREKLPKRLNYSSILAYTLQSIPSHHEVDNLIFELVAQVAKIEKKPCLELLPEIVELIKNEDKLKAMLLTHTPANILESTHRRREVQICKKGIVGLTGPR